MIWNLLELLLLTEIPESAGFSLEEIGICELALSWL